MQVSPFPKLAKVVDTPDRVRQFSGAFQSVQCVSLLLIRVNGDSCPAASIACRGQNVEFSRRPVHVLLDAFAPALARFLLLLLSAASSSSLVKARYYLTRSILKSYVSFFNFVSLVFHDFTQPTMHHKSTFLMQFFLSAGTPDSLL